MALHGSIWLCCHAADVLLASPTILLSLYPCEGCVELEMDKKNWTEVTEVIHKRVILFN